MFTSGPEILGTGLSRAPQRIEVAALGPGRSSCGPPWSMGKKTMHGSTPDSENSVLAIADAVADDSVRIARMLTGGDVVGAMDGVIALVDALDGFLGDIRESTHALQRCSPQLARACAQYRERIDSLLVRIEETLQARDLVGLALALEHGVAKALRDYAYFDAPLSRMSGQSVAA